MNLLLGAAQAHVRRHADLAGAAASGLCFIHCLLTPVLISVSPGLIAYLPGDAGISLILVVAWAGAALDPALELTLSISGSSMLIGAHLLNRSFCRQCLHCNETESCSTTKLN